MKERGGFWSKKHLTSLEYNIINDNVCYREGFTKLNIGAKTTNFIIDKGDKLLNIAAKKKNKTTAALTYK